MLKTKTKQNKTEKKRNLKTTNTTKKRKNDKKT